MEQNAKFLLHMMKLVQLVTELVEQKVLQEKLVQLVTVLVKFVKATDSLQFNKHVQLVAEKVHQLINLVHIVEAQVFKKRINQCL